MTGQHIRTPDSRPPRQSRTGLTSTGARKAGSKSERSRAREFALQALYQTLVGKNAVPDVDAFTRDLAGFSKSDALHFDALLHHGAAGSRLALGRQMAERAGPIVGVIALETGCHDIPLERLLVERALSINTAAAGGNASLMTIG